MMGNYVGMTGNSSIKKNETDNFCEMTTWFARETQWHFFPQDVSWSKKLHITKLSYYISIHNSSF